MMNRVWIDMTLATTRVSWKLQSSPIPVPIIGTGT